MHFRRIKPSAVFGVNKPSGLPVCVANRRVKRKRLVLKHVRCQISSTKMRRNEQRWIHSFFFVIFKFNSNLLTLKKLNSNSLTLQNSNSNSSITRERIQIQSNPTFHTKDSKRILQFARSKSQSCTGKCVLAHRRCVITNKPTTQVAWIKNYMHSALARANEVRGYQPKVGGH